VVVGTYAYIQLHEYSTFFGETHITGPAIEFCLVASHLLWLLLVVSELLRKVHSYFLW